MIPFVLCYAPLCVELLGPTTPTVFEIDRWSWSCYCTWPQHHALSKWIMSDLQIFTNLKFKRRQLPPYL